MNQPDNTGSNRETGNDLLPQAQPHAAWQTLRDVPFRLAVTVPLAGMKLRELCQLRPGTHLLTLVSAADDVPVRVGGALLGWAELDNVDGHMAIRLTRLA